MPIHYDTIEDGQNKKSHLLFSNYITRARPRPTLWLKGMGREKFTVQLRFVLVKFKGTRIQTPDMLFIRANPGIGGHFRKLKI